MKNVKVLFILDHKLMSYRVPFFEKLAEHNFEITIIHPGTFIESKFYSQQRAISKPIGLGFEYRIYNRKVEADIVVHMQNIRIINLWLTTLNPFKKYKLIHWGIGASSAKGLSLNKTITSRMRNFLTRFSSALILYSDYPLPLFSRSLHKKVFIANNTVYNPSMNDFSFQSKDSLLFIGTLNKRKGLDELLLSFKEVVRSIQNTNLKLNIIGEGEEAKGLKQLTFDLNIENQVNFLGRISSNTEKEIYFKKAYACISPKQAGLSVLESFSYGVPFIAYKNAISGGEHLNIQNDYNGYLVDNQIELSEALHKIVLDKENTKRLGANAYKYYKTERQMSHMVDSFIEAFNYVKK